MAHNINSMFYNASNGKPWHELGTSVDGVQTWQQAQILAGLNWQVSKQQLFDHNGDPVAAFGIFRSDSNMFLGAVGDVYTPIQNDFAFEFVDTLIENGDAHYETAGALGKGERIWCLAKVPSADFAIPGTADKHETYLLFETSHDGSKSATAKITTVRVVCQNTLNMALNGKGQSLSVRHTRSADEKMRFAKRLMSGAIQSVDTIKEKLCSLAERRLTRESLKDILERIFPAPSDPKANQTRRENQMGDVLKLYESNDRNAIPKIRGTAYNLLNAVTEYTDHVRTARITDGRQHLTTAQARTESALFGSGSVFKEKALELVLAGSANSEIRPAVKYFPLPGSNDVPLQGSGNVITPERLPSDSQATPKPDFTKWTVANDDDFRPMLLSPYPDSNVNPDNSDYDDGFKKGQVHRRAGLSRNPADLAGNSRKGYIDGWNAA